MEVIVKKFLDPNYSELKVKPITNGLINATFEIDSIFKESPCKFILQKINIQVFKNPEAVQSNIELVSKYLKTNLYPNKILEIVPTLKGKLYENSAGDIWRMFQYVPNSFTMNVSEDEKQIYKVAYFFGDFYKAIQGVGSENLKPVLPGFLDFSQRMNLFSEAVQKADKERLQEAAELLKDVTALVALPKQFIEWQQNNRLPSRIIHADPKISNVLFDVESNEPIAIIDWDTMMEGSILYDFGDMVRSYTNVSKEDDIANKSNFSNSIFLSLKEGFVNGTASFLTSFEKENLEYAAQVVIYIQCVRFLTDYLMGNIYYHCDYPKQNLNRAKNQFYLLKGLQKCIS